ncbi:hypothetical protein ACI7RC_05850 [Brevibacillus sp. B_LB10_24]|uniref:hypothetical protein n=1 Tax=Brevibacillus sp. B_LB10_24 TaxID=3380645 RepID=UPI0038B7B6E0
MKKKWLAMGTGIGVGAVMLLASGFTAAAGSSGYDVYKAALKNNLAVSSITGNLHVTVTDNDAELLQVQSNVKADFNRHDASAAIQADSSAGGTKAVHVYRQEDKTIVKPSDSDVYRVMEPAGGKWQNHSGKPALTGDAENVIDALVGHLRDQVTLEDGANGGKLVSLHLSGEQVPVAVNALGSFIIKKASSMEHGNGQWDGEHGQNPAPSIDLKPNLPKLTDEISVQEIDLDAAINRDNYIEHETAKIVIVGKDEAGKKHEVAVNLAVDLTDLNRTVPDHVDLSGKEVETVPVDSMRHRSWH